MINHFIRGKLYTLKQGDYMVSLRKAVYGEHGYEPDFTVSTSHELRSGEDWLIFLGARKASESDTCYYYFLWKDSIWEYRIGEYEDSLLIEKEEWEIQS